MKKCFAGILLVWKTVWLRGGKKGAISRQFCEKERKERESDVQDGNVREEDADEQRAEPRGDSSRISAPRRWLLENTAATRTRGEQVAERK
jgi:hypothetical protein